MVVTASARVFYGKFGGTEVKVDGEELLLLRADDILARPARDRTEHSSKD